MASDNAQPNSPLSDDQDSHHNYAKSSSSSSSSIESRHNGGCKCGSYASSKSNLKSDADRKRYIVLACGKTGPDLVSKYGTVPDMFVRWLADCPQLDERHHTYCSDGLCGEVKAEDCQEIWEIFNVFEDEWPDEDEINSCFGFVVTGSRFDAHGTDPWIQQLKALIRKLYQLKKKVLGVCFGHQVISMALGGRSNRAPSGWESGIKTVVPNENFYALFPEAKSKSYEIVESHQDQVLELPPEAKLLASSEKCPNEMYQVPANNPHIFCIQGHPEFTIEYAEAHYTSQKDRGIVPKDIIDAAIASTHDHRKRGLGNPVELTKLIKSFLKS